MRFTVSFDVLTPEMATETEVIAAVRAILNIGIAQAKHIMAMGEDEECLTTALMAKLQTGAIKAEFQRDMIGI